MKAKLRPPVPGLNEPMFPESVAEKLDSVKPQPKQVPAHERRHRLRQWAAFTHPHEGRSNALCPWCLDIAVYVTYGLSRIWFKYEAKWRR